MEFNVQLQLAGLLEWMARQMTACHGKTAVIGISGGKDSSTVAALAVAAYGRENVMGVLMPDGVQPDIDYSQALVETLRIPHVTLNIHDAVQGVVEEMEKAGLTPSRQTAVNLPSRIRMATLSAMTSSISQTSSLLTRSRGVVPLLPTLLTAATWSCRATGEASSPRAKADSEYPTLPNQPCRVSGLVCASWPIVRMP